MGTVLKVGGGIVLGVVVLIVALVACVGLAADEVGDQIQEESDRTSITLDEFRSVKVGQATEPQVRERFGEPSDEQEFEGQVADIDTSGSCIYYNQQGEVASFFQFCFDANDVLESKNRY